MPEQLAQGRGTVGAVGGPLPVEVRLPDVAGRAALGSSADVHVLARDDAWPQDGLGAVLRFADQEVT